MLTPQELILYMVFAALLAIAYSLRRMFLLEKSIASIEVNIERLLEVIAREESRIERKEDQILRALEKAPRKRAAPKRKPAKKKTTKRTTRKRR